MMAEKSRLLSKAQVFRDIGLAETAEPLWVAAAEYEERIAPLLETLGRDAEAALHRISAASCYEQAGDLTRTANLYRAALGGPLPDHVRQDVQQKLSNCLTKLRRAPAVAATQ
jgi:hypothetical protein